MVAKSFSADDEIKLIGLFDQGAHSVHSIYLFDGDGTGYAIFEQVEPLKPPPPVIAGAFRLNEVFPFVQCLAHHFRWCERESSHWIAVQLQPAEIWPGSWHRVLIEADW